MWWCLFLCDGLSWRLLHDPPSSRDVCDSLMSSHDDNVSSSDSLGILLHYYDLRLQQNGGKGVAIYLVELHVRQLFTVADILIDHMWTANTW